MRNTTTAADHRYSGILTELPGQLVFIMGCHRSGTSLLYHLLASTGACEYLSAYDIIKFDELVHNRVQGTEDRVKSALDAMLKTEKNRGVDNLPVGVDYPEEYRFLIAPRVPFWPPSPGKHLERLVFDPHLTRATVDRFLEICRKKHFLANGQGPLVLKNPNDFYFNFWQIHTLFPDAKMIFIHRHPLHILNSYIAGFGGIVQTRSAYAALLDSKYDALFQSPVRHWLFRKFFQSSRLPRLVTDRLARSYQYYLDKITMLPQSLYLSLRYEDLCQDPHGHIERIGRWLNVRMTPQVPDRFVSPRNLNVLERVSEAYIQRSGDMRAYLDRNHYSAIPSF